MNKPFAAFSLIALAVFTLLANASFHEQWSYGEKVLVFVTGTTPQTPTEFEQDAGLDGDTNEGETRQLTQPDGATGLIYPLEGKPEPIIPQGLYGAPRGNGRTHYGIDFPKPRGTPVIAPAAGKITQLESSCSEPSKCRCGNAIRMRSEVNGKTYDFRMCHLNSITARQGQEVRQGQIIGTVGNTGNAQGTGPHLHFEVKIDGRLVDPLSIYRSSVSTGQSLGTASASDAEILAKARASPNGCISLADVKEIAKRCSAEYRVNSNLLMADMLAESGCSASTVKPTAISSANARGLMQLKPIAVRDVNQHRRESEQINFERDIFNPSVNICAGAQLMRIICNRDGVCNTDGILHSYYCGPTAYKTGKCRNDAYVQRIRQFYGRLTTDPWPSDIATTAINNRIS